MFLGDGSLRPVMGRFSRSTKGDPHPKLKQPLRVSAGFRPKIFDSR